MKTIYKYPIEITDYQEIEIPEGSSILHVGLDPNGVPCIWAEVNTSLKRTSIGIWIFGTGNPVNSDGKEHKGTFIDGFCVWHVYM